MSHQPGEGEDADADDAADADRGELPEPEALGEVAYMALFLDLLDMVDRELAGPEVDSYSFMSALRSQAPSGLWSHQRMRAWNLWPDVSNFRRFVYP